MTVTEISVVKQDGNKSVENSLSQVWKFRQNSIFYIKKRNQTALISYNLYCSLITLDCQGKSIAFHAVLSKALTNVPTNAIIKFEQLLINEGNGYDPNTGKFTAPVDGIYSFSWNYETNKGTSAFLGGYVDGKLRARVALESQTSTWDNTSGYLVIKMKEGIQFWIQNFSSTIQFVQSDYTSLSGFKISGC